MPPYREVLPPDSVYYEACARHQNRQTARTLQFLHLCDPCTVRLVKEAFNDRPPVYHGETIDGYCGLCNERKEVTLRQWFCCNICWNVVVAYQKSLVGPQAMQDYWARRIEPEHPTFALRETDEVFLSPYVIGGKTKKQSAEALRHLDFLVSETCEHVVEPVFHIELKAGPGSIATMNEFQLDVNDSNDIAGAVNRTKLPAYIIHVQLALEYRPPTRCAVPVGMWWTDVFTLAANLKSVRRRRGEDKDAGYYETTAFKPIESFGEELASRRFEQLREQVAANPIKLL